MGNWTNKRLMEATMYKNNDAMNTVKWLGFVAVLAGMMCFGSGCAGIELGGKVGLYRVDERQESQKTFVNPKQLSVTYCHLGVQEYQKRKGQFPKAHKNSGLSPTFTERVEVGL